MIFLYAALSMGALGLLFGVALGGAAKVFEVKTDPRFEEILNVLPGANCGGCGYPGCSGFATAVVEGSAPGNGCPVGGAPVTAKISEIMGVELPAPDKRSARVACLGTRENAAFAGKYVGTRTCAAATVTGGGDKLCGFGCLSYGDCVKACNFRAMRIGANGLPAVIDELCTACGRCATACPRNLISFRTPEEPVIVACKSTAKGIEAKKTCKVACTGCGICEKNCPSDAIKVYDYVAIIDKDKCTACGICIEKCPQHCIVSYETCSNKECACG